MEDVAWASVPQMHPERDPRDQGFLGPSISHPSRVGGCERITDVSRVAAVCVQLAPNIPPRHRGLGLPIAVWGRHRAEVAFRPPAADPMELESHVV